MYYSDEIFNEVRENNDIVDVISQYVHLKRSGRNYFGICPFHNEKSPSFSVSPDKQIFHCFGCGVGGNVISFIAKIEGIVDKEKIKKLCSGVIIDGKKTSKAKARIKKIDKKKNTSIVELSIHEGRNHQVKKMFEAIGYKVIKLKREVFAGLTLDGLTSSKYRHLSIKEVKTLYALARK